MTCLCHFQKEGIRFKQKCLDLEKKLTSDLFVRSRLRIIMVPEKKKQQRGTLGSDTLPSSSHPFGSFKRMPFAQKCALFKAGNCWFPEIQFRLRSFQLTQDVSSENGSPTVRKYTSQQQEAHTGSQVVGVFLEPLV